MDALLVRRTSISSRPSSAGRHVAVSILLGVVALSDASAETWQDRLKDAQRTLREATGTATQRAREWGETSGRDITTSLNDAATGLARSVETVSRTHGPDAARRVHELSAAYGPRIASSVREAYDRYGPQAGELLATVYHSRGTALGDRVDAVLRAHGADAALGLTRILDRHGLPAATALEQACDRLGAPLALLAQARAEPYLPLIARHLADPATQQAAMTAAVTALAYAEQAHALDASQKQLVVAGLRYAAANIVVSDSSGRLVSLDDYSRHWIRSNAPFLAGSAIEEDPVGSVTYLLLFRDVDYFVNDMRIVPSGGGDYRTLSSTLVACSPHDAEEVLRTLSTIEACERMVRATAVADDVASPARSLAAGLNSYNRS